MYNREREVNRMNYTYILKCSDGTYYTGWTNDMAKRLKTHNEGKGSKITQGTSSAGNGLVVLRGVL